MFLIVDREKNHVLRGPYEHGETAVAVRREMETDGGWDEYSLWLVEATSLEEFYKNNPPTT